MTIRERFFAPVEVVSDLQWVGARLLDADAPDGERSHGRVTSMDLMHRWSGSGRRPARDGIFCQKIFGPVRSFVCACGKLAGEDHAGTICDKCGVLCGASSLRERRCGHITVDGVLHPELVALVAEKLGISDDQVRATAACEAWLDGEDVNADMDDCEGETTGPSGLAAALERAGADRALVGVVVTRNIPVPPPSTRPFFGELVRGMVDPWIGPLNEAWRVLVQHANRQSRLIELEAPPIITRNEQRLVQRAFESVVAKTVATPVVTRLWPEPKRPPAPVPLMGPPGKVPDDATDEIAGIIFVNETQLFVQRARGSWLVDSTGGVIAELPTTGRLATSVHGSRLRMATWMHSEWDWFEQDTYWDHKGGKSSVGVFDLDRGELLSTYPEDLPWRLIENDQPEDLVVGDVAPPSMDGDSEREEAPAALRWGGDRPGVISMSRDARIAWVGEDDDTAVLDLDTGVPLLDPVMQALIDDKAPVLLVPPPDGQLRARAEGDDEEERTIYERDEWDGIGAACAIALTAQNDLRLLHGTGVVSDGETTLFRINAVISAAAFDPAAHKLAIAVGDEIVIVQAGPEPAIVGRFRAP